MEKNHLSVRVATTGGIFPSTGFEEVPLGQKVEVILKKAAKHLEISNTDDWVAKVGGQVIDINRSYEDNHLSGEITIDYGKSHGGGGIQHAQGDF